MAKILLEQVEQTVHISKVRSSGVIMYYEGQCPYILMQVSDVSVAFKGLHESLRKNTDTYFDVMFAIKSAISNGKNVLYFETYKEFIQNLTELPF